MAAHHLAQFNLARAREGLEHPALAGFVEALDPINRLAEAAPGFVWRLQDDTGNSTGIQPDGEDDRMIVNLSVWEDAASLKAYSYEGGHRDVFRRRREWFEPAVERQLVMWWIPAGELPDVAEGMTRLEHLREHGPTPAAFTFAQPFPPPHA